VTTHDVFTLPRKLVRKYNTCDPFRLAEKLGIIVLFRSDFVKQRGAAVIAMKNRFIFINSNLSEQRQRMVCAHELGHLLLHRSSCGKGGLVLNHELFDINDQLEYEANVFAANLLIDDGEMFDYLREGYTVVAIASSLNINVNLLVIKLVEMNKQQGYNFRLPDMPDRRFMGKITD